MVNTSHIVSTISGVAIDTVVTIHLFQLIMIMNLLLFSLKIKVPVKKLGKVCENCSHNWYFIKDFFKFLKYLIEG